MISGVGKLESWTKFKSIGKGNFLPSNAALIFVGVDGQINGPQF